MSRAFRIVAILIIHCSLLTAQNFDRLKIPILQNDNTLTNALAGGLVAPHFNQIDLDDDGDKDLIVFDKVGNVILPFLNQGAFEELNYIYAPEYIDVFPDVSTWILLRDYDGDGIEDLFTLPLGIPGIEIWKGNRDQNGLYFEKILFPNKSFDILFFPISNGETQIYVAPTDIPEIVDVDGDSDLDVLSFEVNGGTIWYYQNMSVEMGYGRDSLIFELADNCYGRMQENGFNSSIALSDDPNTCASFFQEPSVEIRHAGSTISALDVENDGKQDLLIGDISNRNLVLLKDDVAQSGAWFSAKDDTYPSDNIPAQINVFLAAATLDLDNDGLKDLLVTTNSPNPQQTTDHIWFYKNVGTIDEARFELRAENFLVDQMVYAGLESNVSLADIDQDGLMDMVIGTKGKISADGNSRSRLLYYRNFGSIDAPRFVLEDPDYLKMSQFSSTSATFYPSFGDLDGDGDVDMLVGDNVGFLYWIENIAGVNNPFDFKDAFYKYQDIRVGQECRPFIIDVNQDGLMDLVLGERNFNSQDSNIGSINYLQNVGSIGNPIFMGVNDGVNSQIFGNVNTRDLGFINNFSAPYLVDTGDDFRLFVGTESGSIWQYGNIKNNVAGTFDLLSERLGDIDEGMRTTLAVFDIDDDGFYEILVGNRRGGVAWYNTTLQLDGSTSTKEEISENSNILISPNPVNDILYVDLDPTGFDYQIFSMNGEHILSGVLINNTVDVSRLDSGVYVLNVSDGQKHDRFKFVVVK